MEIKMEEICVSEHLHLAAVPDDDATSVVNNNRNGTN
jgi:hypothetical protein